MDLDIYRNFLAVVEAGSFTGASDFVHIAQPALSKQLRNLENFFGTKLIITQRGSRQILLTDAGRVLYQKAKYICSLEDLAKNEIDNIIGGVIGTLRFSIANSRSALFIESSLKGFTQLYPNIKCELFEASIGEQTQQLLNGITELGILSVPLNHQDSFEILFRRDEELVAVFNKDSIFLEEDTDSIELKQLEDVPVSISGGSANIFLHACEDKDISPRVVCISTTRSTAMEWARVKAAIAIVPVEPGEKLGDDYVVKKISDLNADVYKTVVKVKDRPLSVAAQHFLKFYARTRGSQQVCDLNAILKRDAI
ncbi:MAG: LysR family transcriptional regulator [Phascolarctobacterium sp.]|nr:LysR family transcriptional regulator [Phascolarctobacterium sp.]